MNVNKTFWVSYHLLCCVNLDERKNTKILAYLRNKDLEQNLKVIFSKIVDIKKYRKKKLFLNEK